MTMTMASTEDHKPTEDQVGAEDRTGDEGQARAEDLPPSCRDLVGILAQTDRRDAFAALALGATTVAQVAERAKLRPAAAAVALQKLVDGRIAAYDADARAYRLIDDTFRLAVQAEVRISGRGGGDGAGAYFRKGRLTSIPGKAEIRSRVLAVVADSFDPGTSYSEAKVNAICGQWYDDWVSLRRALVDEGLLHRDESGTHYERRTA
ncbi:DUF2087 domain-containing protein [Streptomyces ipomoeae]|jgi:hypothetical protein|uniref:DUF2087 domain-containing protein n=2 Tax=Streptomyces ipomoeae TaxID=103232 RepID=L1L6X9_9ACTN|nr:hypothetical protein STRIP9103_03480 [Streptomyces ipomoeae 91-03]MDX2845514.1 DUF2087 domain-containing protein [Streptomyces ipomoeae]